jgi:hypothetical protein
LDALSRFFGVSILEFFPGITATPDARLKALLRAAEQLDESDLDELQKYAEFRVARATMATANVGLRPTREKSP